MEQISGCRSTDSVVAISFDQATLARSNLGGLGPGSGPPSLLLEGVSNAPGIGRVDLEIANLSAYTPSTDFGTHENRLLGAANGTFMQLEHAWAMAYVHVREYAFLTN